MTAATAVRERPILFKPEMALAILDGRKTQTRRIIKPVRGFERHNICRPDMAADPWAVWWHGDVTERVGCLLECPNGKPGTRLWVREGLHRPDGDPWLYRADNQPVIVDAEDETAMVVWAHHKVQDYCPSMFMPRWASRITLEITEVRAQRLQDISEEDARAEGVELAGPEAPWITGGKHMSYRAAFFALWDSIHGTEHPWASNPFTWAISFRRIKR